MVAQAEKKGNKKGNKNLGKRTIMGALWLYAARYSGKILVFITTLVLARLLTEEEFGVAGYATISMTFLEMSRGLGVSSALIYHPDDDDRTSTGFWLILVFGFVLCALAFFFVAPLAGWYFNDERAVGVVRLISFAFPINSFALIHDTQLRKALNFKKLFVPDLVRSIIKGGFSITFAFMGFGAWSLVIGHLAGSAASVVVYWFITKWVPRFVFKWELAKPLLSYGLRIVSVDFQGTLLNNLDYLMIGRYLGAASLGIYTLAFKIPELTIKQFYILLGQVVFPTYSKMQDDLPKLTKGYLTTIRFITLITVPIGIGLIITVEPFVITFLTDKWLEATTVIPQIALFTLFKSVGPSSGAVYKAVGKPQILARIKTFQLIITIPALYWASAMNGTIAIVGWTMAALSLIEMFVNLGVAIVVLQTNVFKVARQIIPAWIAGLIMAIALLIIRALTTELQPSAQLAILIWFGGLIYLTILSVSFGLSWIARAALKQMRTTTPPPPEVVPSQQPYPSLYEPQHPVKQHIY